VFKTLYCFYYKNNATIQLNLIVCWMERFTFAKLSDLIFFTRITTLGIIERVSGSSLSYHCTKSWHIFVSGSRFINDLRLVVNYDLHKLRCFNEIAFHQANRKLKLHKFHT